MIFRHWGGTYMPVPYITTHHNPLSASMAHFEAIFAVMQIGIENKHKQKPKQQQTIMSVH